VNKEAIYKTSLLFKVIGFLFRENQYEVKLKLKSSGLAIITNIFNTETPLLFSCKFNDRAYGWSLTTGRLRDGITIKSAYPGLVKTE